MEQIFAPMQALVKQITSIAEIEMRPLGLSHAEMRVLYLLYTSEEEIVSQDKLTKQLLIDRSNVGRAVQKLESKNLVRKVFDEHDTRIRRISLTEQGHRLEERVLECNDHMRSLLDQSLSIEDILSLQQSLLRAEQSLTVEAYRDMIADA